MKPYGGVEAQLHALYQVGHYIGTSGEFYTPTALPPTQYPGTNYMSLSGPYIWYDVVGKRY